MLAKPGPHRDYGNLYADFEARFPEDRGQVFLETPAGRRFTFDDIGRESARIASALRRAGLEPGDRVTVQAPKSPEFVWLYLACLRSGLIFHPLNDGYRREELLFLLADAEPGLVVCSPEAAALFGELTGSAGTPVLTMDEAGHGTLAAAALGEDALFTTRMVEDGTAAVLLYTSGTTGRPKGAVVTHRNLSCNAQALVRSWGFSPADRLLHALPVFHAHGLFVGLGCALMSGSRLLFLPKFDAAQVVRQLPRCTVMMGVPTYYTRLLAEPGFTAECAAGIRVFISGSAPLPPAVFAAVRERTGREILERYGMTETGMNTSNPLAGARRPGTVGLPLPGVIVRIADGGEADAPGVGEIELRGPNVFPGYWRAPEATRNAFTADGFFRTGDLGMLDGDGYLAIVGRAKDLVISGGLNVYPREVEVVLDALPGIGESAIIGVPHPDFGEAVVAVVVPAPGAAVDEAALITGLRDRLAAFKVPKRIIACDTLPRNSMGKVDKGRLRREHANLFSADNCSR